MGTLTNSNDADEMQHNAAFHQGLHCFYDLNKAPGTEIHHNLETATCDPLKYKMGNHQKQRANYGFFCALSCLFYVYYTFYKTR